MTDQNTEYVWPYSGYDTREVDAAIAQLNNQISDLGQQNASLSQTITQYEQKFSQMSQATKQMQEERIAESLRMTGLMNTAAKIAEQTKHEAAYQANEIAKKARREADGLVESARREAEKILNKAHSDAAQVHAALTKLCKSTKLMRQNNTQYITDANLWLDEIDKLINNMLDGVPEVPPAPAPASAPEPTLFILPESKTQQNPKEIPDASPQGDWDPYDDFVKKIIETGQ